MAEKEAVAMRQEANMNNWEDEVINMEQEIYHKSYIEGQQESKQLIYQAGKEFG